MAGKIQNRRFSAYISEAEAREIEMMKTELGLPTSGAKSVQDRLMLYIMLMSTRTLMRSVREAAVAEKERDGRYYGEPTFATWEDVYEAAGVPAHVFEAILDEAKGETRKTESGKADSHTTPAETKEEGDE